MNLPLTARSCQLPGEPAAGHRAVRGQACSTGASGHPARFGPRTVVDLDAGHAGAGRSGRTRRCKARPPIGAVRDQLRSLRRRGRWAQKYVPQRAAAASERPPLVVTGRRWVWWTARRDLVAVGLRARGRRRARTALPGTRPRSARPLAACRRDGRSSSRTVGVGLPAAAVWSGAGHRRRAAAGAGRRLPPPGWPSRPRQAPVEQSRMRTSSWP